MPTSHKLKIAVLMGGPSDEHEVSLSSGRNVLKNLDPQKYEAEDIVIDKKGEWPFKPEFLRGKTDLAFIAMHGTYGEDGTVQHLLDIVGVPYTGSRALASALAMNKFLTLEHLRRMGLTVPQTILVSKKDWLINAERVIGLINGYIHYPLVLKPNRLGSSVGVHIVKSSKELPIVLENSFQKARDLILQPFIEGREVTCGVLDHGVPRSAYALPPTEIVPVEGEFFDYTAKYDPKGALEITPARLPAPWLREVRRIAVRVHNSIGCRGMSRTDMILGNDGKIYILELNTIPGLTENSLLPKAARAVGISFPKLLDLIINAGFLSSYPRK